MTMFKTTTYHTFKLLQAWIPTNEFKLNLFREISGKIDSLVLEYGRDSPCNIDNHQDTYQNSPFPDSINQETI